MMLGCATGTGIPLGAVVAVTVTPVLISDPAMAPDSDGACKIAPATAAAVMTALPPMTAKDWIRLLLMISSSESIHNEPT